MSIIKPQHTIEFKHKQPPDNGVAPKLPSSFMLIGSTGMGKSTAIQHMLLSKDFYRGCFSRIYLISGSVTEDGDLIDKSWEALAEYNKKELKIDPSRERTFFPADPKILQQLVNNFEKIAQVWKDKISRGAMKNENLRGICVILDDISDSPKIARHSDALTTLAVRARHLFVTPIFSVQKSRSLQNSARVNVRNVLFFRARNRKEYDAVEEEVGAHVDKETFKKLYNQATQGHSFLFIRLDQEVKDMFYKSFESKLVLR